MYRHSGLISWLCFGSGFFSCITRKVLWRIPSGRHKHRVSGNPAGTRGEVVGDRISPPVIKCGGGGSRIQWLSAVITDSK